MDACFLTSRSFTKTREFIPNTKAKWVSYPRSYYGQFRCRKPASSSSISCCNLDSWKPMEEDDDRNNPSIEESDWRAFRARLVAGEKTSRAEDPSSWAHPDVATVLPEAISIGDKWAHTIPEPEKGCLLVATEKLDGVHIFERTVILLLSVGPVGPYGVIINRPSLMSIKEAKSTVLDMAGTFSDERLFFGGPLEEGLFLVRPKSEAKEVERSGVFKEVMKGVYYGTRESVGLASEMVKRKLIEKTELRFFDGYCGWEKEQLKDEILGGYWKLAACSKAVIELGCINSNGLWDEILGLMRPKKVL